MRLLLKRFNGHRLHLNVIDYKNNEYVWLAAFGYLAGFVDCKGQRRQFHNVDSRQRSKRFWTYLWLIASTSGQ